MEKKLLHKIALSFLAAECILIVIFALLLYWHESKGSSEDIDLVLNQFEAAYTRAEERQQKKQDMYAVDYLNRGTAIDFILGKEPDMQSTAGLQELCRLMEVEHIFLLDQDGRIVVGSVADYQGRELLDGGAADMIRQLISGNDAGMDRMVLDSEAVFENVPASDFVAVKSRQEAYAALLIGIDDSVLEGVEYAADVGNVLGSVPVVSGQTLLVADIADGRVLGSTQREPYGEQIDDSMMSLFLGAEERQTADVYGARVILKSRVFQDMLLVSIQQYDRGIRLVMVQILGCALILLLIFFALIIITHRYFRYYVFNEFEMIENTVNDLLEGKENTQFHTERNTEMRRTVAALNKLIELKSELELAILDADKDSVTGLVNRNGFEKYIGAFMERADKKGVMLLMDVDNFKSVNDNMGHPEGDRVLKVVADCLKNVFRKEDLIVRLGGDEFAVLMETDIPKARLVEKLDEVMHGLRKEIHRYYQEYHVTISIGAALITPECFNYGKLYQCADDALYEAKRAGKDRYVIRVCEAEDLAENSTEEGAER